MKKTKLQEVREKGFDEKEWKKLYHKHQQEYVRRRLRFIAGCVDLEANLNRVQLHNKYEIHSRFDIWIEAFLSGGLEKLCQPIKRKIKNRISDIQKQELRNIILTQIPKDYGIDRNLWTAEVIIELIKTKWNVDYKDSRIYEILDDLGLSHQKAHRDYANSDPQLRKQRRDVMEKK
jgi:transposase